MYNLVKIAFANFIAFICFLNVSAQNGGEIFQKYIGTARLHPQGNQAGIPILTLNSGTRLQLSFDDFDADYKNYYYTYQLCDYNWNPSNLTVFDYIKGYSTNRISSYRNSSIAYTKYIHYDASLPTENSYPSVSGNYLLKVFLDGDTSKLVFTKRMMVVDTKTSISATVVQPFTASFFNTHQRIRFTVDATNINAFSSGQQMKAVIFQNNRWDNLKKDIAPSIVRANILEYNNENIAVFPGGKEWRWIDLRSHSLRSDRVSNITFEENVTNIFARTDIDRSGQNYVYYSDLNGGYSISTYNAANPLWQGDYAIVHFSFATPNGKPYESDDIFIAGAFTDYNLTDKWKMTYNTNTNLYECKVFLKQGYYDYTYITKSKIETTANDLDLDGNFWDTENKYTILLYYKGFSDRNDKIIGISQINSRFVRAGSGFLPD